MFFGVVLQPGKAYSQTLEYDLLLSQVALGESSKKTDKTTLLIEVEGHKFVLATLRAGIVEQAQLNVQLIAGTSIKLLNPAGADLHVIGNYIIQEEDDFYDYDEFDSEDSEFSEDSEGSDDDDEDEEGQSSSDDDQDVFSREKTNKRSLDRDSDASQDSKKARTVSDSFKTNEKPLTKLPPKPVAENKTPSKPAAVENKTPSKADNKTPSKPAAAENKTPSKADNKTPSKAESKTPSKADNKTPSKADNKTPSKADNKTPSKADNKTPSKPESKTPSKPENETPSKPSSSDNKTPSKAASSSDSKPASSSDRIRHPSGLAYTVLKSAPAAAPTAKKGRTVVVAYKGTLQQGGKQFDAQKKFDFKLGVGDVIKGWDIGVEGMKVGEKRKLFVPPSLAYGKDGVNENGKWVIPRNAALDFEVELLQIKD